MKRIRFISVLVLLYSLLLTIPVFAVSEFPADQWPNTGESLGYVTDTAGILTASQRQELSRQAQTVSETHDFGVYLVTVESFRDYTDSSDVFDAATALYSQYALGIGEDNRGLLLLLSMQERDFSLITYSDYGNFFFDDVTRENLTGYFLDNFARNDWYGGFEDYIAAANTTLEDAPGLKIMTILVYVAGILLFPLPVAAVVVLIKGLKMKSVAAATEASAYAVDGLTLTNSYDQFSHTTQTRRKIESNNTNKSSGGSTRSKSSGGFSGTSGKF